MKKHYGNKDTLANMLRIMTDPLNYQKYRINMKILQEQRNRNTFTSEELAREYEDLILKRGKWDSVDQYSPTTIQKCHQGHKDESPTIIRIQGRQEYISISYVSWNNSFSYLVLVAFVCLIFFYFPRHRSAFFSLPFRIYSYNK